MGKERANRVRVSCEAAATINLHELVEIQGELKRRNDDDIGRMRKSIIEYGFSFPFFVWKSGKTQYVLDGHGRLQALYDLEEAGWEVPPLPIAYVKARSKAEAKQKLLRLNSTYGEITMEGLKDFAADIDIDWDDIALPTGRLIVEEDDEEIEDETYSRNIEAPVYTPTMEVPPDPIECIDEEKAVSLLTAARDAYESGEIDDEEFKLLKVASKRHIVFDYGKIAELYAHAGGRMQRLMEQSALVIVDFDQAIEQGFVRLSTRLKQLYAQDSEYEA